MPWFHDKRVDRTLRKEQRQAASPRAGGHGPPSRSRTRSRSRSQPLTRARMAELEAGIVDLEGRDGGLGGQCRPVGGMVGCVETVPDSPVVPPPLHAMRRHQCSLFFFTWVIQGILEHESADASGIINPVSCVIQSRATASLCSRT